MKTILIVDDDPISVRLIAMTVERNGYASVAASSAAEAIALLDRGQPVEVVITDQNLGGMTGLELYAALRADVRFHHLPVILCTGLADRATIDEALRLGIRHFIVKPIMPRVVIEKVTAIEAERPRVMESRASAMARLQLSDAEYKSLIHSSQQHITGMREELSRAYQGGDRVTTIMVATRLREPARLLNAARLLAVVELLETTKTWHELEDSVARVLSELSALEDALDIESKPHLIGRSMGYLGPDIN